MYAKISRWIENDIDVYRIVASTNKELLDDSNKCEYVYTGQYDESAFAELLYVAKVKEFCVPSYLSIEFSNRFYEKYLDIFQDD